jgi:tetratricopeptide (TPR) repeat protein
MARFAGFAGVVLVVFLVLRALPLVGGSSFLSLWLAVILASVVLARLGNIALTSARMRSEVRRLGAVDSPHNRGKLGSLYLARGRARAALPHLEAARAGEPDSCEWGYRLGLALFDVGRFDEAAAALRSVVVRDEEYAYGAAQLRLAEALRRAGDASGALAALDAFQKNHGDSPQSAFRRGQVLRALGCADESRQAFARVGELAAAAPRYQRRGAHGWALRAWLARLV